MPANDALQLLRAADPARKLEPLPDEHRRLLRDRVTATDWRAAAATPTMRSSRAVQLLAAAVLALAVGVGAAWAAGAISPLSVFENNAQHTGGYDTSPSSVWNQEVIPSSVV